jgi:hypothetical protein|tara:strand:- start:2108 stop:2401 length:294 start_codon:yes stop_codon:yes gene_type:complete
MEENNNEDIILNNIKIVTNGIIKDIGVSNRFSSWKNTEKGLRFIIKDKIKFNMGVIMWINIVESQILNCNNNDLLLTLINNYNWIENFLEIKKLAKM